MGAIAKGSKVQIHGYVVEVVSAGGKCEDVDCERPTVEIIDPEGNEDTVHEDECQLVAE